MSTQPEPLTADELAEVRADHEGTGTCTAIQAWPCTHARLLATLDEATAAARAEVARQVRELRHIILNGGLRFPGFDHWRERVASKPSDPDDIRWDCSCGYSGSPETVQRHWSAFFAFEQVVVEGDGALGEDAAPRQPEPERGTCWFCKGTFVIDALIAGYDTFEEQRLACLACNERMSGNWRPATPDTTTGTTDE